MSFRKLSGDSIPMNEGWAAKQLRRSRDTKRRKCSFNLDGHQNSNTPELEFNFDSMEWKQEQVDGQKAARKLKL